MPVDAGQVFAGELSGTAQAVLAVGTSVDARAGLLSRGRLRADVAVEAQLSAALSGRSWAQKDIPAGAALTGALTGSVWASKDVPTHGTLAGRLMGHVMGSKDLPEGMLAAAVLTTSAEAGVQSVDRAVFQLTIPPGGELRIDSEFFTVLLDGENALHTQEGAWIELSRALARLTVECASGGPLEGQIVYQERYL